MKSSIDKMKSEKCPQSLIFLNYDTKELGQNWNMRRQWKDISNVQIFQFTPRGSKSCQYFCYTGHFYKVEPIKN